MSLRPLTLSTRRARRNRQVAFRFGSIMGEKRITRSSYGRARPRRDFPRIAKLYLEGMIDLDSLVSERIGLGGINSVERMRKGETIRSVVQMS